MDRGIANILHRDTIAVIVGSQTFARGERCFAARRVEHVEAARGELRGRVLPTERDRAPYVVRIWVRDDGLAHVARVTAAPDDMTRAMNLAEVILCSLEEALVTR